MGSTTELLHGQRVSALERLRTAKNLTREDLAEAAGVTARCIRDLEVLNRRPHRLTARALATALGCDTTWIYLNDDGTPRQAPRVTTDEPLGRAHVPTG